MAQGLKDTLQFITGDATKDEIIEMSAYLDNEPIETKVQKLMATFDADTEVIILTDMMAGSVNQKFFVYRTRPHTQIISGMNLPLALAFAMEPKTAYISSNRVKAIIEQAKDAIVYINDLQVEDDDDE
ncbi:phosphotransferase system, mannose fructose-specific component IIA [Agrilactobacillus composti DSM 18527 = JCM 14202]|uniref:Phosphotransferase system, mannose fructose-specific component IIA n=2 Tax=Agrilactobacillus TaxID=2767875 RepID=A0A0R1Y8G9_9LACO|nr:phosphotransferase system, mannose fructose-specific component IIA [Agrilactobacillus composti DSM 18527 = JCM 14202]